MKYTVVTPVKNEAKFIRFILDSMIGQSILPEKWIVVDDGSTDNTLEILKEYSKKYNWISIIENQTHQEERAGGSKVVRAFYKGFDSIKEHNYDFIVKLDGDLKLPINYFEKVIQTFKANPKVGICGGYILNKIGNDLIKEIDVDYHVRGAFKSVRKECFIEIGGFQEIWNWDGLDLMEAMRKGWETKVFDLPVIHFRPTGSAYNPFKFHFKDGKYAYKLRSSILLHILRSLGRLNKKPYLLCSIIYFFGYFYAFFKQEKLIIDKELGRFSNKFHTKRIINLLLKKV